MTTTFPKAVLFDLLTALIDSWTLWNDVAGSEERGRAWRAEYLRLTYGCGSYVPYEQLVREAAVASGLAGGAADALEARWLELPPWSGAQQASLDALAGRTKLGVVTNCSIRLGRQAAGRLQTHWDCIVTAEEAGCYKPDPRPYRAGACKRCVSRPAKRPSSRAPVTTCSAHRPSVSGLTGTTASASRAPTGRHQAALERTTLDDLLPWLEGRLS
jgi:hypothetical protein